MDIGIVVDLETTGLDPNKDRIIEIGILEFVVETEQPPAITSMYAGLEDPNQPLSPEIESLTGIRSQILHGRSIDWRLVQDYLARASLAIAHNAEFDIGFLKKRPELANMSTHWACSYRHIDWDGYGFRSKHLSYLAADHGFLNPFAHRALFDCATTFRLIAPHLNELIENSYEREFRIFAVGSPYETKDILKARKYHWEGDKRCWSKRIFESDIEEEVKFLQAKVYNGDSRHQLEQVARIY